MWPNQMQKEIDNAEKFVGSVQKLKTYLLEQNDTVLEIKNFSHHNISLIFNHILKACILKRKTMDLNGR